MGDLDRRAGKTRTGPDTDPVAEGNPLSAFARDAVLDLHRLSWICRQRRRVQGDGPGQLWPPDHGGCGSQGRPADIRWRLPAQSGLFRLSYQRQTVLLQTVRGDVRSAARPL